MGSAFSSVHCAYAFSTFFTGMRCFPTGSASFFICSLAISFGAFGLFSHFSRVSTLLYHFLHYLLLYALYLLSVLHHHATSHCISHSGLVLISLLFSYCSLDIVGISSMLYLYTSHSAMYSFAVDIYLPFAFLPGQHWYSWDGSAFCHSLVLPPAILRRSQVFLLLYLLHLQVLTMGRRLLFAS